ncbi:flavin reductase family protein [Amycolatopsis sp. NPDC005232]|uniref:flavin reductase family protein n=1 Tax=Amycolatopsis sp. NPDC005232 TaxID=3157027 RepID=UPI0033BCE47C
MAGTTNSTSARAARPTAGCSRPSRSTSAAPWPPPCPKRAPHLGVTVLPGHHGTVARQLAGPADSRFTGLPLTTTAHGAITLDDGIAWFDTTIERALEAGDHTLVLLRLHSAAHAGNAAPLVFHRSCFRQAV